MADLRELILKTALFSLLITGLIILWVFATGQTFGQRCERLFPNDTAAQEQCVHTLSQGDDNG